MPNKSFIKTPLLEHGNTTKKGVDTKTKTTKIGSTRNKKGKRKKKKAKTQENELL